MQKLSTLAFSFALLAASGLTAAQTTKMTRAQHNAAEEKIEADAKSAKAKCDSLNGNAKDVCEEEAEGREKVSKAELTQQFSPSARNARNVQRAKTDAAYEVAKEKCGDQSGNAKDACEAQARAERDKGRAALQAR
jgi:hypothetical protein